MEAKYYSSTYYSTLNEWLEDGCPLGKSFLIVRECTISIENINEGVVLNVLETLCTLIIHNLAHYRDELEGSGYYINPALSMFDNARMFNYENETFGVCAESAIVSDRPRVRISVGAIATILLDERESTPPANKNNIGD